MNRDIPFYQYLTDEQKDMLDRSIQQVSYKKGQMVHRHGEACVGIIFVRKGRLSFFALSEEGREITILRAKAGQTCVLSASCVFQAVETERSRKHSQASSPVLWISTRIGIPTSTP